jgi:hypothetical protein
MMRRLLATAAAASLTLAACGGGGEAASSSTAAGQAQPAVAGKSDETTSTAASGSSAAPTTGVASTVVPPTAAPAPTTAVPVPATATPTTATPGTTPPGPTPTTGSAFPIVPLSAGGARLVAIPQPGNAVSDPAGPALPCASLVHSGWTLVNCQRVATEGGRPAAWVIERNGPGWRITLWSWSGGKGVWLSQFAYLDESGFETAEIDARLHGMEAGSPFSALVVGYRVPGSGQILLVEIVDGFDGDGMGPVAGAIDLSHGSVRFPAGALDTWSAQYPGGEPNCCPAHFDRVKVWHNGSGWVSQKQAEDAENPGSELA